MKLMLKESRRIVLGVGSIKLHGYYLSHAITNTSWAYDVWSHAVKWKCIVIIT